MATADTIRDLGREMAKRASEQQQADITAAISQGAAMNPDNKSPFQDQNEFLSNEVRKIGEASEERARLTSERAREEYDNQVRGNILKEKELAENSQQEKDLASAQTHGRNMQQAQAIAQQLNSIPIQPGENNYTMPLEKMAQIAKLTQEWNALRERAPELELMFLDERVWEPGFAPQAQVIQTPQGKPRLSGVKPKTFDDGSEYRISKTDDGVKVELPSGEVFQGSTDEVLNKLAKSNAHGRAYADEWKNHYREVQTRLNDGWTPPQNQQQPDLGQQYSSISDYWTDQQAEQVSNALAKRYGFSNEQEMVQYFKRNEEIGQSIEDRALASDFYTAHPEFPGTDAASDILTGIIEQNGWQWNINSMEAAHALALQRGMYQPLSQELIAAANGTGPVQQMRPTPPPMVRHGGNPEIHSQPQDDWSIPLAELRARAIKAQLSGGQ